MNTKIRKADRADIDKLCALSTKTINANYRPFLGDEAVDGFIGSGACDQYVKDNIDDSWVILLDGIITGFGVCKESLIDLMMIDHNCSRRGLGTQLINHCESILFENYETITIESFADNEKANNFYKKNGWIPGEKHFDESSGVDKLIFSKKS